MVSKNHLRSTFVCFWLTSQMISSLSSLMRRDQTLCFGLIIFHLKILCLTSMSRFSVSKFSDSKLDSSCLCFDQSLEVPFHQLSYIIWTYLSWLAGNFNRSSRWLPLHRRFETGYSISWAITHRRHCCPRTYPADFLLDSGTCLYYWLLTG